MLETLLAVIIKVLLRLGFDFTVKEVKDAKDDKANHDDAKKEAADQFKELKEIGEESSAEETRRAIKNASRRF
jgi:hypothetical protein